MRSIDWARFEPSSGAAARAGVDASAHRDAKSAHCGVPRRARVGHDVLAGCAPGGRDAASPENAVARGGAGLSARAEESSLPSEVLSAAWGEPASCAGGTQHQRHESTRTSVRAGNPQMRPPAPAPRPRRPGPGGAIAPKCRQRSLGPEMAPSELPEVRHSLRLVCGPAEIHARAGRIRASIRRNQTSLYSSRLITLL